MSDIIMSWTWFDRMIAGAVIASIIGGPILIVDRLDRIIKLLRQLNQQD